MYFQKGVLRITINFLMGMLLALFADAQHCTLILSGSIADADTKAPLEDAIIEIKELKQSFTTDREGHYHFYNLCPGAYTIIISHVNCEPLEIKIKIERNLVRNFVLPHKYNELQEVIVSGKKDEQANTVKETLSRRDVDETRGLTLGEVLTRVNGVTVLQTGSTIFKPVIHGLHSQRILILNNGVRQEGQQWGSEHAPEIDPFIADKFTVLKGAGALKYGSDAIGGVILVEPKPLPKVAGLNGEINTAWFANNRQYVASGMIEQNLKNIPSFSWRLQATYKRGGNSRTPDYWLYNTGVKEFNYSVSAGWRKPKFRSEIFFSSFSTGLGIFMGSHIGNLTDLENAIRSPRPVQNVDKFSYEIGRPKQQVSHYLIKSKTEILLPNNSKLNLMLSHQENIRKEFDRALITDRPELDLNIGTSNMDINWEQAAGKISQANIGVVLMRQENVWKGSRFFIPNFIAWNAAAYALNVWNIDQWSVDAGLRYDFRNLKTFRNQNNVISSDYRYFNNISASSGITRRITQHWKWLLNAALAWRPPQVNELYVNGLHHGTASFEIGDPNLKSEKAYKFSTQLKYTTDSSWQIDITLYSNLINGFINLIPTAPPTLTLRGAYPTFRFIQTNTSLSGADLSIGYNFNHHFSTSIKGAFLFARDRRAKDWLQQMPANRVETELTYSFSNSILQNSYLALGWLYVMKQKNVPAIQNDYLPPPPAYNLLNLEFATMFQLNKKTLNFGLSIYNLMNERYRDYMNRFRYFNDEVGRSIVIRLKVPIGK